MDPNGDGDTRDRANVINMSLGSDYGIAEYDDLSVASENAANSGILVVASAGNGANKPFIAGTPANAPSVLSVAQTQVPSARTDALVVSGGTTGTFEAAFQPFTPRPTSAINAPIKDAPADNRTGCRAFPDGYFNGTFALIDRGSCNVSFKTAYAQKAGAVATLVALVAPGDPVVFGNGGLPPDAQDPLRIPTYNITQAAGRQIRAGLATAPVNGSIDPNSAPSAVMTITGSSSRGPSSEQFLIKPEIGAPGASVSAIAGSGTGSEAFGGTSGAAPVVSGAGALLLSKFPGRSVREIKALLMNTAETQIRTKPEQFGGTPVPISRIGGGELRVDRAAASSGVAFATAAPSAALSFGQPQVTQPTTLRRQVTLRNYSTSSTTYAVRAEFRFPDSDAGAAQLTVPASVTVPARSSTTFPVDLRLDPATVKAWRLNSGPNGNNPAPLTDSEIDGYIRLTPSASGGQELHLPFDVLPRITSDVQQSAPVAQTTAGQQGSVPLRNQAAGTAGVDGYTLLATSPQLPPGGPPGSDDDQTTGASTQQDGPFAGQNFRPTDLKSVGSTTFGESDCDAGFGLAFAFETFDRQTILENAGGFAVEVDTNRDGKPDYLVQTLDLALVLGTAAPDGRTITAVTDLATGDTSAFFFADQGVNAATTVLALCGEQIGLTSDDLGRAMDVRVSAYDPYFSGRETDSIPAQTIVAGGERYVGGSADVPSGGASSLPFFDQGPDGTYGRGLLLIEDAPRNGVRVGAPDGNSARVVELQPGTPPANPGPGSEIPEAPVVALLPLAALGAGGVLLLRRRSSRLRLHRRRRA